jgi:hypothetical protein
MGHRDESRNGVDVREGVAVVSVREAREPCGVLHRQYFDSATRHRLDDRCEALVRAATATGIVGDVMGEGDLPSLRGGRMIEPCIDVDIGDLVAVERHGFQLGEVHAAAVEAGPDAAADRKAAGDQRLAAEIDIAIRIGEAAGHPVGQDPAQEIGIAVQVVENSLAARVPQTRMAIGMAGDLVAFFARADEIVG